MKILHTVEFYEPSKGGAQEVVKQLSERLVKHGHDVIVATTHDSNRLSRVINGVKIEGFDISGNNVEGIAGRPAEIRRYQDFLTGNFDIILNYAAQSWTTDLTFEVLHRISAKKILVPCGYSGLYNPKYAEYFRQLPSELAKYDSLIYMSLNYQDAVFGIDHGLKQKAVLIPNGASAEEFDAPDEYDFKKEMNVKTPYLAITVANHYVSKGHKFVVDAFAALKRKDLTLVIIGQSSVSHGIKSLAHFFLDFCRCRAISWFNPRIKLYTGADRAAVVSAFKQADIFLFGSKLECAPLVMYEAFASKTPMITTPVGNTTDYRDNLFLVRTTAEMTAVANGLLGNEAQRKELGERGHALWKKQYTWDVITKQYETLYKKLCQK